MTAPGPPPLPDQLFVLDRGEDSGEFLDMLLTLCTFGMSTSLLLVESGITALTAEHRGIPVTRFSEMGLQQLMVGLHGADDPDPELPDSVTTLNSDQIRDLYARVPRILHP
ncbi:hypothetical protein CK501_05600 [Halovibrio salipaludis]|uniref:Uncharacterized protein n=1 Tax=Halovibrio salipaludis TaxID=2032626 RepID=A0A2A2F7Y5_9GAMM|nr:hypothetical protein [Halovibrio salipaludis]PAU81038.1 hypothetical protein CK501_05600 [Halovibrio salipaludis]